MADTENDPKMPDVTDPDFVHAAMGIAGVSMLQAAQEAQRNKPNYTKVQALATLANAAQGIAMAIQTLEIKLQDDDDDAG